MAVADVGTIVVPDKLTVSAPRNPEPAIVTETAADPVVAEFGVKLVSTGAEGVTTNTACAEPPV